MSKVLQSLKTETSQSPARTRGRPSKIDRGEWPRIVERRAAGDPVSAIARDYGVTPGAISNILKKAADTAPQPREPSADAPAPSQAHPVESATTTEAHGEAELGSTAAELVHEPADAAEPGEARPVKPRDVGSQSEGRRTTTLTARRPVSAPAAEMPPRANTTDPAPPRAVQETHEAREDRAATGQAASDPLAQRLLEAATACAEALDDDTAASASLPERVQEVRRALAAIEIAQAKTESRRAPKIQDDLPEDPGPFEEDEPRRSGGKPLADGRSSGTVKFYSNEKGYGFIAPDDGSQDVFVSTKAVEQARMGPLRQGARVSFTVRRGPKSPEAQDLRRFDS